MSERKISPPGRLVIAAIHTCRQHVRWNDGFYKRRTCNEFVIYELLAYGNVSAIKCFLSPRLRTLWISTKCLRIFQFILFIYLFITLSSYSIDWRRINLMFTYADFLPVRMFYQAARAGEDDALIGHQSPSPLGQIETSRQWVLYSAPLWLCARVRVIYR